MEPQNDGFAATEDGGVSNQSADVVATGSPQADATASSGQETPADNAGERTPRMVPETDLRNLQSVKDRELAAARAEAENYKQAINNLTQAFLEQRWEQLPPEEAQAERSQWQTQQAQQALQAQQAQLEQLRVELNAQAAPIYADQLAKQYGVDAQVLLTHFHDPTSMEAGAKLLSLNKNAVQLEARQQAGVDRMDGTGGSGGPAWEGKKGSDLLSWYFKNKRR